MLSGLLEMVLVPITLVGRALALLAMLIGIPFFTAVSGTTWNNLNSANGMIDFQSAHELVEYQVGVVGGTANQNFLENNFIAPKVFDSTKELYQAVIDGEIDLAVHDEVSITAFAKEHSEKVIAVGPRMYRQNYVWYLPLGASHKTRRMLELSLLEIRESGKMEKLQKKWLSQ